MMLIAMGSAATGRAEAAAPARVAVLLQAEGLQKSGDLGGGVRVGVISGGVRDQAVLLRQGILPADVALLGSGHGRGDEGDWMMQIVHQIAPAAKLGFCAGGRPAKTVGCASALIDKFHADIIIDDVNPQPVIFRPTVKDLGLAALARQHPKELLFTGVGNNGAGYYQSNWMATPLTLSGVAYQAQDFGTSVQGGSQAFNSFVVPAGAAAVVDLGTNALPASPMAPCPERNPLVTLALADRSGHIVRQAESACPGLSLFYRNTSGQRQAMRVAVLLPAIAHPKDLALKLVVLRAGEGISPLPLLFHTSGAVGNSATSAGLVAVAAGDPDSIQGGHYQIEPYSNSGAQCMAYSAGPHGQLQRLAKPSCFEQPAFVVPDKTVVTMVGPRGLRPRPFGGNSAAGPAAAGAAALLLARHVPPLRIVPLLEQSALALPGHQGWDGQYGYGLINVGAAASLGHDSGAAQK
ncbi:MAG: hypothetical protein KGQ37_05260 [Hyphomicrobiales bacterium]|nr:hypothetical protein [Hyphomicrobiales bacterium]